MERKRETDVSSFVFLSIGGCVLKMGDGVDSFFSSREIDNRNKVRKRA